VLEIALGKDYFAQPHQACTDLMNEIKLTPNFTYNDFLVHPKAMFEYAVLMTRLATFIEYNPQKRIEWLVKAMASNPNTHVVNGVRMHVSDASPPNFYQIKSLVLGVFDHIFRYVHEHQWEEEIQTRLGPLKYPPSKLFSHVLLHIESLTQK
jgi:hypothetical protein